MNMSIMNPDCSVGSTYECTGVGNRAVYSNELPPPRRLWTLTTETTCCYLPPPRILACCTHMLSWPLKREGNQPAALESTVDCCRLQATRHIKLLLGRHQVSTNDDPSEGAERHASLGVRAFHHSVQRCRAQQPIQRAVEVAPADVSIGIIVEHAERVLERVVCKGAIMRRDSRSQKLCVIDFARVIDIDDVEDLFELR